MVKKITRHDLKEEAKLDTVGKHIIEIGQEIYKRRTTILAIIIGIVAVIVGFNFYYSLKEKKLEEAAFLYGKGVRIWLATLNPENPNPDHPVNPSFATSEEREQRAKEIMEKIIKNYPRTIYAVAAKIVLGDINQEEGEVEKVLKLWSEAEEKLSEDSSIDVRVDLSKLYLEAVEKNNFDKALEVIDKYIDQKSSEIPKDILLFYKGKIFKKAGRNKEAKDVFSQLIEEFPTSSYTPPAREELLETKSS